MNNWLPNTELPEGSLPTAALLVVTYIDSDGINQYMLATKGDMPSTTYLGMTVKAQHDIINW